MRRSAQAFLAHILDYAGMFPPARLSLEESLRNYLDYQQSSPQAWILGRFVCPAARLPELAELVRAPEERARLRITALGRQSLDMAGLAAHLDADLQAIEECRRALGRPHAVDTLELTLPGDAQDVLDHLDGALPRVQARLQAAELRGFFEIARQPDWRRAVVMVSQALSAGKPTSAIVPAGLKLRCGGIGKEAFPGDEEAAHFMICCRDAGLPWKATAGLYHPYRHWDASLQLWQHGFINVIAAGVLALCHPLQERDVVEILADRAGRHFRFDEQELAWKDWRCPVDRLIELRAQEVLSFGSCSFEEPCQDLLALQLIDSA